MRARNRPLPGGTPLKKQPSSSATASPVNSIESPKDALVMQALGLVMDPIGETGEIVEAVKAVCAKMSTLEVAEFRRHLREINNPCGEAPR
jgi:hypothetical protein